MFHVFYMENPWETSEEQHFPAVPSAPGPPEMVEASHTEPQRRFVVIQWLLDRIQLLQTRPGNRAASRHYVSLASPAFAPKVCAIL